MTHPALDVSRDFWPDDGLTHDSMDGRAFPITFLSEDTSMAELFHIAATTKKVRKRAAIPTPHGIVAFELKSPQDPVAASPVSSDAMPQRLLLYGSTSGAMKILKHVAGLRLPDPSGRGTEGITVSFDDGGGCFLQLFAEVARANRPVMGISLRNPKDSAEFGTLVIVRDFAVPAVMERLGVGRWQLHLMKGWAAFNYGAPMRIARLQPGISGLQFREEIRRVEKLQAALRPSPPALDCVAFSMVLPVGPLLREGFPSRLILASFNPILYLPLTRAAAAAGAPQTLSAYGGFELPSDLSRPRYYAELFERMEQHDLPALATSESNQGLPAEHSPMVVLARTEAAIRTLTSNLGIGSWAVAEWNEADG